MSAAESTSNEIKRLKTILLVTAMEVEHDAILENHSYQTIEISNKLGTSYAEIKSSDRTIFIHKSGVGGTNAAVGLSAVLERHNVDAVIALGVAGALSSSLDVGDLVISKSVIQHDSIFSGENGAQLMAPGHLFLSLNEQDRKDPVQYADPTLVNLLKDFAPNVSEGTILSGSEFVGSLKRKKELAALYPDALAIDMEAAAIAQICSQYRISWVIAKTIADRFHPATTIAEDYSSQLTRAAKRGRSLVDWLLADRLIPTSMDT